MFLEMDILNVTGVTIASRLFTATSTTCSTLLCVDPFYETAFSTHRHPAHPVSVPIRHILEREEKSSAVTTLKTYTYIERSAARYRVQAVYSCM